MPRPWTVEEKERYYTILENLYIKQNKTIGEIGKILGLSEQTIYGRLKRVGINPTPERKQGYLLKKRTDIVIPQKYTPSLAEFFGIMLGDGKLSKYQIVVNLGNKELEYVHYVVDLIENVFGARSKIGTRKTGYRDVYLGSTQLSQWLQKEGLVYNKVLYQVNAPQWIFKSETFIKRFIRGIFDTDGSIYRLRWGLQLSFTNKSEPLLKSVRNMLMWLGYSSSKISCYSIYVTRKNDIEKFFKEINPKNTKHQRRYREFKRADTEVVKRGTL